MTEEWAKRRAERIQHAYEAFREHEATLSDCGMLQVLNWQKPGTLHYRVRYVFDTCASRIYISGDLGAAVVHPTWEATFEKTYRNVASGRTDVDVNEGYFMEKLEATSDRYGYDRDARIYLWLVGLKLAWRQLHKESADGQ